MTLFLTVNESYSSAFDALKLSRRALNKGLSVELLTPFHKYALGAKHYKALSLAGFSIEGIA